MTYATDDALRRELYIKFRSRGDQTNEAVLQATILELRAEKAKLLGFADWADYITARQDDRLGRARRRVHREGLAARRSRAPSRTTPSCCASCATLDPKATAVADWQKVWLENQVKKERYEVDASEVRQYFPYERVLAGLLEITSEIFDLELRAVADAAAWHPSVLVYDVMRGASEARPDLPRHASARGQVQARGAVPAQGRRARHAAARGRAGLQLPAPRQRPALLEHDDVVTMFHEFGHLMHHVLGGHQRWVTQSRRRDRVGLRRGAVADVRGVGVELRDAVAVRAPSRDRRGDPDARSSTRCARADKFGLGTATVQQIFYAAISLGFHRADPATLDQLAEVQRAAEAVHAVRVRRRARGSTPRSVTSSATRRCTTRTSGRS